MILDYDSQLHYLTTLLRTGNYTVAARELYISQPYLTQIIQRLERDLQLRLVNRSGRQLALTEAGQIYLAYLQRQVAEKHQLQRQLARFTDQGQRATLHLGVLESLGTFLWPRLLPAFQQRWPQLHLQLVEDSLVNNERRLQAGELDFLLGQLPLTSTGDYQLKVSAPERYYFVIPPTSPAYRTDHRYRLADLLDQPLILTTRESSIRLQVDSLFLRHRQAPQPQMETRAILTATRLATSGAGITIAPKSVIDQVLPGTTGVDSFCLPEAELTLRYFLAYQTKRSLTAADHDLLRLFVDQLGEQQADS